jgi:heme/copper-type cytochrome/quinol oxidase subunit 2
MRSTGSARRAFVALSAVLVVFVAGLCVGVVGLGQEQGRREITLTARKFAFSEPRIEVAVNDVVRITLVAEDIPHSFTIDEYRIARRAAPGKPVTFEFRADRAGTFPFYCNLTIDDGCREMRGELVVTPRLP